MQTKLLEYKKVSGPNLNPGHQFPISETYFIQLKTNNFLENIIIECLNPAGILYVLLLNKVVVNGEILNPNEYENVRKKLQSVNILIIPLIHAIV